MSMKNQANVNYASGREAAQARRQALSQSGKAGGQVKASTKASPQPSAIATNTVHSMVCNDTPCLMTSQVSGRELALAHRRAASAQGKQTIASNSQQSVAAVLRKEQALSRKSVGASNAVSPVSYQSSAVSVTSLFSAPSSQEPTTTMIAIQAKNPARRPEANSSAEALRKERALARKAAASNPLTLTANAGLQNASAVRSSPSFFDALNTTEHEQEIVFPVADTRINARQLRQEAAKRKAASSSTGAATASAMRKQRRDEVVPIESIDCGCAVFGSSVLAVAPVEAVSQAANNPLALQTGARAFAMARRTAMSIKGKVGANAVKATAALVGRGLLCSHAVGEALVNGLNGRQLAMARRAQHSSLGASGKSSVSRPSGKVRKAVAKGEAVVKVEESETLSGQLITGGRLDRSKNVTGNEQGSTRSITGTEYVSVEQYDQFDAARPKKNTDKVVPSETTHGKTITSGNMFQQKDVTGTEVGECRKITGTEYIAADVFTSICGIKQEPHPKKVLDIATRKNQTVSGMPIVQADKVTGVEVGAERAITGTSYISMQDRASTQRTVTTFQKVGESHTLSANQVVTGTMVERDEKMTGDEQGFCSSVSGTQYLGMESFKSFCRDVPYTPPAKTGRSMTASGQEVTGVMVGRKPSVTGDEAGSCREISGDQYFSVGEFGKLCTQSYPSKIAVDQTNDKQKLSGTSVERNELVTGGEVGGCAKVSGTQYVSPRNYREFCQSEPAQQARKVGVDNTLLGQRVTGPMMGRANNMTGNEPGSCSIVTGTGYSGQHEVGVFCGADQLAEAAERAVKRRGSFGHTMTGLQPSVGGKTTGDFKGACQTLTGAPYVGWDQVAETCGIEIPLDVSKQGFSVEAPLHAARGLVTGTAYGAGERNITGSGIRSSGRVSGTPEFRHTSHTKVAPVPTIVETSHNEEAGKSGRERVTGEGRQSGRTITGDDWQRNARTTGTEGKSAHSRNPTMRGDVRELRSSGAHANREIVRPEAPVTKVTGSAGVTVKGPVVTLSGGARG